MKRSFKCIFIIRKASKWCSSAVLFLMQNDGKGAWLDSPRNAALSEDMKSSFLCGVHADGGLKMNTMDQIREAEIAMGYFNARNRE